MVQVNEILDDPKRFLLHYFPHYLEKLEPFHEELIDVSTGNERSLILYPAGHGKTTLISTLLPIWEMCRDPNVRIATIHKNDATADNITRATLGELQTNRPLIRDFGAFAPEGRDPSQPWGKRASIINQRTRMRKEPTLSAFGAGSRQILGMRTDKTICDDIITTENSATPQQRQKIRSWFDMCVETGPEFEDSQLTVVGTRFHPSDLYGDLLEMVDDEGEPFWVSREIDAIVDFEKQITLWPERWPWKRLMKTKAKLGTLEFNKRLRNIAMDPTALLFKEEYIKGGWIGRNEFPGCLDPNYSIGDMDDNWRAVGGFDPAVGAKRGAKFCAHIVVASGQCDRHERCLWIVDLQRDQYTMPQQTDLCIMQHQKYGLVTTKIEANSYQMGLCQAVEQKMNERGLAFRVEPHYTNRVNKPDPDIGVEAMVPWFEQGKVHIPWADPASRRRMTMLIDELLSYPGGRTTDTVMALWFGWLELHTSMPRYQSFNRNRNRMAWQPRRGNRRVVLNPYYK